MISGPKGIGNHDSIEESRGIGMWHRECLPLKAYPENAKHDKVLGASGEDWRKARMILTRRSPGLSLFAPPDEVFTPYAHLPTSSIDSKRSRSPLPT
jgi:hypothetical protein